MAIAPFGWKQKEAPAINATNLELMHTKAGEYSDSKGTGELLGARVTTPPAAHFTDFRDGTTASPVKIGVSSSLSRVDATTRAEVNAMGPTGTDGPDGATVFRAAIKGAAGSQVQVVAGSFMAWQTGEANGGEGSPDACPIYGFARVTNSGVGRAIPMYLESSRETTTSAGQQAAELRVKNQTGVADSYVAGAPSKSMGVWLNASGNALSAAGFQVGFGFGQQFDVGYAVNEGAVKSAAFRDDSNSKVGVLIKGEHAEGAIRVEPPAGTYDPLVLYKVPGNTSSFAHQLANGNAGLKLFVSGAIGGFLSDTAAGDVGVQVTTAGRAFRVGTAGKGSMLAVNETEFGVFGKKAVQQSPAAGETALREALKAYGILA